MPRKLFKLFFINNTPPCNSKSLPMPETAFHRNLVLKIMVKEDRFLEVNDIHKSDFLECSGSYPLRCVLGLPGFGVTGGCPAPYRTEAEAGLSVSLALLLGCRHLTPPPAIP